MTVSAQIVRNMLKIYSKDTTPEKPQCARKNKSEQTQDIVAISKDGRKRMMERLKNEAIEYLKLKR